MKGAKKVALAMLFMLGAGIMLSRFTSKPFQPDVSSAYEGRSKVNPEATVAPGKDPKVGFSGKGAPSVPPNGENLDSPAARPYEGLANHGRLVRQEKRRYEAHTWETDFRAALALPAHVRLERRSALLELPDFRFPLVRVDRVYRMDRNHPNSAMEEQKKKSVQSASHGLDSDANKIDSKARQGAAPTSALAVDQPVSKKTGSALMDAGGGELIWENAMVADHLMVQVHDGVSRERLESSLPQGARVIERITSTGLYLVSVPSEGGMAVERAVLALNQIKEVVRFAEPDFILCGADTTPNDSLFTTNTSDSSKQWHLPKIMAPRSWDVVRQPKTATIANQSVVAVVDTGVDLTHPDLLNNLWSNPGETGSGKETNGIDDDGNGKIDDWRGWNFVELNNNAMDDVGHGTHVAGIIGAVGNNAGGADASVKAGVGVCWGVRILPLRIIKALGAGTYGTYSAAVGAMDYIRTLNAATRRVAVANHSWGGSGYSLAMFNAINNPVVTSDPLPVGLSSTHVAGVNVLTVGGSSTDIAKIKLGMTIAGTGIPAGTVVTIITGGSITLSDFTAAPGTGASLTFSNPIRPKSYGVVHVAAAGNSQNNIDRIPVYPACLPSGFIVSVGATDNADASAIWAGGAGSNFGALNLDLFAPGSSIWSTRWKQPGDPVYGFESRNGTSMAAPQVAGALALVRMWQPALTDLQARQVLIEQVEQVTSLKAKCVSGGRLNIAKIIDRLYQPVLVASGGSTGSSGFDAVNPMSAAIGLTGLLAVSRGQSEVHVLAVDQGVIWAWGYSLGGQLGGDYQVGTDWLAEYASYRPVQVPVINDCRMVAARGNRSYALRSDGTVWMWGADSNDDPNNTPAQIPSLSDIVWIAGGWAVKADGTVWSFFDALSPAVQKAGLSDILMVIDGDNHQLALKRGGTEENPEYSVWAWGNAANGKLGNGQTTGSVTTPVMVAGLPTDIRYIAAGGKDSYAVTESGAVYYWGRPEGMLANALVPALLPNLTDIATISSGTLNTVAITTDGRVFTWGRGYTGQLGSGVDALTTPTAPAMVLLPADAGAAIYCSNGGLGGGTVAVMTENDIVYCWGDNEYGALGQGQGQLRALPTQISPPGSFTSLFTGDFSGFARDASARLFAWGSFSNQGTNAPGDLYGQVPTRLYSYPDLVKIDTSQNKRIGLATGGAVWTWGNNVNSPTVVAGLSGAVDVTAGGGSNAFFLAALSDGTVHAWGENESGQLGDGTTTDRLSPVTVSGLTGIHKVFAFTPDPQDSARSFSFAIRQSDGAVFGWGFNEEGQLGDGGTSSSLVPVTITSLTGVTQITATTMGNFALKSDGTVWAWSGTYPALPTQVTGLPVITSMASTAALFAGNDGRVWVLGTGFGPVDPSGDFPKPVIGVSGVTRVQNTGDCVHVLKSDGSLWVWGFGLIKVGSLGDGFAWSNVPLPVIGLGGISSTLSTLGTGNTSDSWQLQYFTLAELLNDNIVSDTATPAGDGISNLLKYALGLNPKQRYDSSSLPVTRIDVIGGSAQSEGLFSVPTVELIDGKRYLAFTVTRNAGIRQDLDYMVEVSTDLVTWNSGDPHTVTVLDTAETLEVYSAQSLDDVPAQFMRLKIQRK